MVIDVPRGGLDDVDIFIPDRVLDLATRFAHGKLCEDATADGDAEDLADAINEGRVRISAEDDDVANHIRPKAKMGSVSLPDASGGRAEASSRTEQRGGGPVFVRRTDAVESTSLSKIVKHHLGRN